MGLPRKKQSRDNTNIMSSLHRLNEPTKFAVISAEGEVKSADFSLPYTPHTLPQAKACLVTLFSIVSQDQYHGTRLEIWGFDDATGTYFRIDSEEEYAIHRGTQLYIRILKAPRGFTPVVQFLFSRYGLSACWQVIRYSSIGFLLDTMLRLVNRGNEWIKCGFYSVVFGLTGYIAFLYFFCEVSSPGNKRTLVSTPWYPFHDESDTMAITLFNGKCQMIQPAIRFSAHGHTILDILSDINKQTYGEYQIVRNVKILRNGVTIRERTPHNTELKEYADGYHTMEIYFDEGDCWTMRSVLDLCIRHYRLVTLGIALLSVLTRLLFGV